MRLYYYICPSILSVVSFCANVRILSISLGSEISYCFGKMLQMQNMSRDTFMKNQVMVMEKSNRTFFLMVMETRNRTFSFW